MSHALEMTIHFYYPTLELFCFSFAQLFTHSKFCLPNPFLFGAPPPPPPPAINNDRSCLLISSRISPRVQFLLHCLFQHHSILLVMSRCATPALRQSKSRGMVWMKTLFVGSFMDLKFGSLLILNFLHPISDTV